MAIRIKCGIESENEKDSLELLERSLPDDWVIFSSIPRHLTGKGRAGREIDALILSTLGAVVVELKKIGGEIIVSPLGEWMVNGRSLLNSDGEVIYPTQQAEKAAQTLKSALGAKLRDVYIHSCVLATGRDANVKMNGRTSLLPVASIDDASEFLRSIVGNKHKISLEKSRLIFGFLGKSVPDNIADIWSQRFNYDAKGYSVSDIKELYELSTIKIRSLEGFVDSLQKRLYDYEVQIADLQYYNIKKMPSERQEFESLISALREEIDYLTGALDVSRKRVQYLESERQSKSKDR